MIGPRSTAQLTANLGIVDLQLSAEQIERLDSVSTIDKGDGDATAVGWAAEAKVAVA